MAAGLLCLLLLLPTLISCDSQRGDWYDTYQGDGYNYDVPVEAQLTGAGGSIYSPTSGQWQDAYNPVKRAETPKKEETNILEKFKSDLSGVSKQIFGGLNRLTGGAIPVAEDRSAEPILDFDFDFNIGHPRLGYLGNGFHTRAAKSNEPRYSDLEGQASEQSYQGTIPLPTSYSNFQTPFVASNPRPQRDSPAALYEYQEPSHQGFIPVSEPERSNYQAPETSYHQPSSSYQQPSSSYQTNYQAPEYSYESPSSYYTPDSGYSADPASGYDAPPYAAPGYEEEGENYYEPEPVTKPPLHIKIKQDFEGLVDGIVGPIKSLIPGKKTPATTSNSAGSYQLVPSSSSYDPASYQAPPASYEPAAPSYQPVESNYIDPAYEPEVSNRYETPADTASPGMFSTPYGKPPLMEKIKQDFFSWLPKAKREIKIPANAQNQQAAYPVATPAFAPAPAPAVFYPEQSLPQKQQHVRQAPYPTAPAPAPAPAQAPSFLLGGAGDKQMLFKIIQIETDGAPLYQIVPTSSTGLAENQYPVQQQKSFSNFNTAATSQSYSHTPNVHEPQQYEQQQQQHQVQQHYVQQQQQPEPYTPAQSAQLPAISYQSQVAHPLPPPQTPIYSTASEKVSQEKPQNNNIFNKVLSDLTNTVNPRTRTSRKTDSFPADSNTSESKEDSTHVFIMSAPDLTKEVQETTEKSVTESEVLVPGITETLDDADLHTFQVEIVSKEEPEVTTYDDPSLFTTSSEEEIEEYANNYDNKVKDGTEYEVEETLP